MSHEKARGNCGYCSYRGVKAIPQLLGVFSHYESVHITNLMKKKNQSVNRRKLPLLPLLLLLLISINRCASSCWFCHNHFLAPKLCSILLPLPNNHTRAEFKLEPHKLWQCFGFNMGSVVVLKLFSSSFQQCNQT